MAALSASMMMIKMAGAGAGDGARLNCTTSTGHAVAIERNYLGIKRVSLSLLQSHRSSIDVKCMAVQLEGEKGRNIKKTSTPSSTIAKEQTSTKLGDVFSFAGAAPETINGRLAMVGFVSVIGVELASGRDLFSQLSSGDGVSWLVLSMVLLSAASLVPMLKGVMAQSKSQEIMLSSAEIWNGRFAMLVLVALAFTEYVKGGPLV